MKALVKYSLGKEGMEIREVPMPEPEEGEVRIAVKAVGICGSDIHNMRDERPINMPVIFGHEFVGVIDKTCGDVRGLKEGDWVTGLPACYGCGECKWCRRGEVTLCPERKSIGRHKNGAMAEYLVMPARFCFKVRGESEEDRLMFAAAEPLACAVRGVYEKIDVMPGDVAVVSGPGTLGLFAAEALKSRGAYVIMSGLPADAHRLEKAKEIGVDKTADSLEGLKAAVYEKNPDGADIVCETSGAEGSLRVCLDVIRTQGTLLQIGVYPGDITVPFNTIYQKELHVVGMNSTAVSTWEKTIELLNEKKIDLKPVISLKLPLDEWSRGFDAVVDKTAFKVLLIP